MTEKIEFYPIVNFITGPPGIFRNGGIWRWIKKEIVRNEIPQLMTQVLHFVDFSVTRKTFDQWFANGLTLKDWIKKENAKYNPKIFTDSGGFKLLYDREYDLSEFGIEPTQDKILQLQLKYGSDLVASLDYPIPPNLSENEAKKRMEKSIENCIKLMELIYDDTNTKKVFPYLAVHGRNSTEIKFYMRKLFENIENCGFQNKSFGIAIGSLVPVKNHYELLIEIVSTVREVLQEYDAELKVHVFGISGYVIPFLAYLGVNSFDSNTYVQAAQNLRFITSKYLQRNFYKITKKDLESCNCKYCQYMLEGGISSVKKILKRKGYKEHRFNDDYITKSKIYACIAMHNLNIQLKLMDTLNSFKIRENFSEWLVEYSKGKKFALQLLAKISKIDEILRNAIENSGVSELLRSSKSSEIHTQNIKRKIRFDISPDSFDITQIHDYNPIGKRVMLILPCTSVKPYSKSRTHRRIVDFLKENSIPLSKVEIITLSGKFGPVPQKYEELPVILEYEYVLTTKAKNQIKLISARLSQFLEIYKDNFDIIVAYITSRAYRRIITFLSKKFDVILLPKKPKKLVSSELLREKNLKELLKVLKNTLSI